MFYDTEIRRVRPEERVGALIALTPAESKRLIAKGVAGLPEVKRAMKQGIIIVGRGTTDAFVAEELTGDVIEYKGHYAAGYICDGELSVNPAGKLLPVFVLRDGKRTDLRPVDALREFGAHDVSIKGANAVDADGNVGVLAAGPDAGTIGGILPILLARQSPLICPVGLEKMIPSVPQACRATGLYRFKYSTGVPATLIPAPNAIVVTEIQAFEVLAGVKAVAVAGGGIAGSEGIAVLALEGDAAQIEAAMALVKSVKGEPAVSRPFDRIIPAAADLGFDAVEQWKVMAADAGFKLPGLNA
jgi:hypothetical protein